MSKMKYIFFSFLLTISFVGCTTTKNVQTPLKASNEVINEEIFANKENWQPVNKNPTIQDIKNEKVVK